MTLMFVGGFLANAVQVKVPRAEFTGEPDHGRPHRGIILERITAAMIGDKEDEGRVRGNPQVLGAADRGAGLKTVKSTPGVMTWLSMMAGARIDFRACCKSQSLAAATWKRQQA